MLRMPELLAPAGSTDALYAALRCGADAVYLGATQFSARQNARNFDLPALREAAKLCHLYGAKLYLTLNTLLFDEERAAFCCLAADAADAGVDAFIMQDLGAISLVRQLVPTMPVHASTQMSVHTPAGAVQVQKLGITRVVAARECSAAELSALCATGMDIEVFCHGALCMSVSGQCYLSAMIGSRSANRGQCAQACRLPFSACGTREHCALSLRDLCLVQKLAQLCQTGVASLKIEGRMKRPEYVAAAVTAYRAALTGETPDLAQLQAVFSRSGFTDGYFTGERRAMFGVRGREDVVAAKDALPALAACYRKPRKATAVLFALTVRANQPAALTVTDSDGNVGTATGDAPLTAEHAPLDEARALRQLEKLGDTIYSAGALQLHCDAGLMLPASSLNALRRDALAALDQARIMKHTPVHTHGSCASLPEVCAKPAGRALWVQAERAEQLAGLSPADCAFVLLSPDECEKTDFPRQQVMLVPPRFIADEAALAERLAALSAQGFAHLLCENLAHVQLGGSLGMTLHGGFGLNAANSNACAVLAGFGLTDTVCSMELKRSQLSALRPALPVGMLAYGRLPLMLTRLCPIREEVGCANCTHALTDRTGRRFPVRCHGTYVELLNAEPLYLADRLTECGDAAFLLLLLHDESAAEVRTLLHDYRSGAARPTGAFTRGLYYRGVTSPTNGEQKT